MRILDYPEERENVQENNKFVLFYVMAWGFQGGTVVKNCLPIQKIRVHFLGQEDPMELETAIHFSILAWKIPWTEEPGGPQSLGLQRVGHNTCWTEQPSMPLHLGYFITESTGN